MAVNGTQRKGLDFLASDVAGAPLRGPSSTLTTQPAAAVRGDRFEPGTTEQALQEKLLREQENAQQQELLARMLTEYIRSKGEIYNLIVNNLR